MDFRRQSHASLPLSIVGFALSHGADLPSAEKKKHELTWLEGTCCVEHCSHNFERGIKLENSNLRVNIEWEMAEGGGVFSYEE